MWLALRAAFGVQTSGATSLQRRTQLKEKWLSKSECTERPSTVWLPKVDFINARLRGEK
jgi:hypothetical protein